VDEIGLVGVKLQKILLFLGLVNIFNLLHRGGLLLALVAFIILYIGFFGALKRRERMLRFYYVFNVVLLVFAFVGALFLVFFFMAVAAKPDSQMDEGPGIDNFSPLNSTSESNATSLVVPNAAPLHPTFHPMNETDTNLNATSLTFNNNRMTEDGNHEFPARFILCWVFGIVVFALKITSIVLAGRMARMLRERNLHNLAHPITHKNGYTSVPQNPQPQAEAQAPQIVYIQVPMQMPPGYSPQGYPSQGYPFPQAYAPYPPQPFAPPMPGPNQHHQV